VSRLDRTFDDLDEEQPNSEQKLKDELRDWKCKY